MLLTKLDSVVFEEIGVVVVCPNIEYEILAIIIGRGGTQELGATFWSKHSYRATTTYRTAFGAWTTNITRAPLRPTRETWSVCLMFLSTSTMTTRTTRTWIRQGTRISTTLFNIQMIGPSLKLARLCTWWCIRSHKPCRHRQFPSCGTRDVATYCDPTP